MNCLRRLRRWLRRLVSPPPVDCPPRPDPTYDRAVQLVQRQEHRAYLYEVEIDLMRKRRDHAH